MALFEELGLMVGRYLVRYIVGTTSQSTRVVVSESRIALKSFQEEPAYTTKSGSIDTLIDTQYCQHALSTPIAR